MIQGTTYSVGTAAEGRRILGQLRESFSCLPETTAVRDVVHADSFEWQIFRDGGSLCWSPVGGATELLWQDLDGRPRYRWTVPDAPGFASDLPDGPFRSDLTAVIDVRRLLPRVRTRLRLHEVCVIDRRGKTIARVELRGGTARIPGSKARGKPLPTTIRLRPLRGYETAANRLRRFMERQSTLSIERKPDLVVALDSVGLEPGDVPSRQSYPIDAKMRTDAALKAILGALLETLRRNLDGLSRELDIEFLHDARVAVRRQRSALGQIRGVFDRRTTDRLQRDLSWLGQLTSTARDLDVHLLDMRIFAEKLPAGKRGGLEPLVRLLQDQRRSEQRRLSRGFASARFRRYSEFLSAFVARPAPSRSSLPNAARPIREVAAERIRKAHRRLVRRGSTIDDDSPAEQLHRLRIDAKKLRYLLEFFAGLFSGSEVKKLVRSLKGLQDNLGSLNDLAIQQQTLTELADRVGDASPELRRETRATVEYLIVRLAEQQSEERGRFRERFAAFSDRSVKKRFDRLFTGKPKDAR